MFVLLFSCRCIIVPLKVLRLCLLRVQSIVVRIPFSLPPLFATPCIILLVILFSFAPSLRVFHTMRLFLQPLFTPICLLLFLLLVTLLFFFPSRHTALPCLCLFFDLFSTSPRLCLLSPTAPLHLTLVRNHLRVSMQWHVLPVYSILTTSSLPYYTADVCRAH